MRDTSLLRHKTRLPGRSDLVLERLVHTGVGELAGRLQILFGGVLAAQETALAVHNQLFGQNLDAAFFEGRAQLLQAGAVLLGAAQKIAAAAMRLGSSVLANSMATLWGFPP